MDVQIVKAFILFGLLLFSFLLGFIPIKCIHHMRDRNINSSIAYKRAISIMSCFAAGVFITTCAMDLLPDTREALQKITKDSLLFSDYPVSEFIMILGLLMMLTIEQAVTVYQEKQKKKMDWYNAGKQTDREVLVSVQDQHDPFRSQRDQLDDSSPSFEPELNMFASERSLRAERSSNDDFIDSASFVHVQYNKADDFINSVTLSVHTTETDASTFRSFLLLAALSLHSLFEGLAVGLQKETSEVIRVFLGLVIHKGVLAFSLGMTLTQTKLSYCTSLRSLFTFSISSPIGIAIGLTIVQYARNGETSDIVEGILQGVACGTFLYVTFFEILQNELNNPDIRLIKVLFIFLGFICMSGLFLIRD